MPKYEGVVILGFPRSGTTLLRRLIDAHPLFCCPPETYILRACSNFLREDYSAGGLMVGAPAGLAFSGISETLVIEKLREMAFGFFRQIAAKSGKKIWVEKTAFDIFHLENIEKICADKCRFVCTTRNPLDVIMSVKELTDQMEVYMPELHDYIRHYPNQLEAFAHAWIDANFALLRFIECNEERCIRVSYEGLLEDSDKELARVFEFLEAPVETEAYTKRALSGSRGIGFGDWKTYAKATITKESTRRWRSLSDESISRLADILNPVVESFGYPKITVKKDVSPDQSRHKFELGRLVSQMTKK